MPQTRPFECPACGYDRLSRVPEPVRRIDEGQDTAARWACRLCEYEWQVQPLRPTLKEDWALV
jgi:transposase-like protein